VGQGGEVRRHQAGLIREQARAFRYAILRACVRYGSEATKTKPPAASAMSAPPPKRPNFLIAAKLREGPLADIIVNCANHAEQKKIEEFRLGDNSKIRSFPRKDIDDFVSWHRFAK
jgi:hypothetical protein